MRHGRPITIETLPKSHRELRGLYHGETDEGCAFQLYVQSGTRQASGNQLMKAHIDAMSRGRPMSQSDLRVQYDEIYVIVGRGNRKDIRLNANGTYSHGNVFGHDLREIVTNMIKVFGPRPRPTEEEPEEQIQPQSAPKPF